MAIDFGGILSGLFNQQPITQGNILSPQELQQQTQRLMMDSLPGMNAYNTQLAGDMSRQQLGYEAAINPYANPVRTGAFQSVLGNLNLGTSLDPALQADITRKLYETNAASGFGYSPGGTGQVLLQTGLQQQALQRQRQQDALAAAGGLALTGGAFQPTAGPSAASIQQNILQENAAQNILKNTIAKEANDNQQAFLATGARILGGAAGAIGGAFAGNPALGAQTGMQAGNILFPQSGQGGAQQGNMFSSLLSFGQGIGGPQYGIGAGRGYADAQGNFQSSILARPVAGFAPSNAGAAFNSGFSPYGQGLMS